MSSTKKKEETKMKESEIRKFKTFRSYFSYMLRDCMVTGVSSIIQSKGWLRKLAGIFLMAFSLIGFLYQSFQFLQIYWEYSTVKSTRNAKIMMKPALTLCDNSIVRRRAFCKEFPESCLNEYGDDKELFCFAYPEYCEDPNNTVYLKANLDMLPDDVFNISFTKRSGFHWNETIKSCEWYIRENSKGESKQEIRSGCSAVKFVRVMNQDKIPTTCYAINSAFGEKNYISEYFKYDAKLKVELKMDTVDYSYSSYYRFLYLNFHHPSQLINPFEERFKMSYSRYYKMDVHQETVYRLPKPFKSLCKNYEEDWIKNGGRGPLNQKDCREICKIKQNLQEYGCVLRDVTLPHEYNICPRLPPSATYLNLNAMDCMEQCEDACLEIYYVVKSTIAEEISYEKAFEIFGSKFAIILEIDFHVSNSKIISHKPKYESMELFSYIGGYLGIWLGWSIVALFDFFETLARMLQYPLMKKRKMKKTKVKPFI